MRPTTTSIHSSGPLPLYEPGPSLNFASIGELGCHNMSHPLAPPSHTESLDHALHVVRCTTDPRPTEHRKSRRKTNLDISASVTTFPRASSSSHTSRSPPNRLSTRKTEREIFAEHLRAWALNHDSSVSFHGSISLLPPKNFPHEEIVLGKSVTCNLTDAFAESSTKRIVIRLYQSKRYESEICQRERGDIGVRPGQSIAPYQLVVRSASGWVPARQYLDRQHLAYLTRSRKEKELASRRPASKSSQRISSSRSAANNDRWTVATQSYAAVANLIATSPLPPLTGLSNNGVMLINNNRVDNINILRDQPNRSSLSPDISNHVESPSFEREKIKISPLFRPFLRLPQELQDEILYQAVGHTRVIDLDHAFHTEQSSSATTSPTTMSKLFRISKSINQHMIPHVFRCTDFQFGITGFTKFLWQLGPVNRSNLRHLTFRFGKDSLLHCIRWMAPDPVWELFEPPVSTTPPTLIYFWRCQLQDLMKELNLSTVTIDISDVQLADVPMLVRIIKTALNSVEHIRVVDSHARTDVPIEHFMQDIRMQYPDLPHATWRESSIQYHNDYKHQRWHMKHVLALRNVDLGPILHALMDKDKSFFDS